jgi:ribosomal 50S subunit-recycling heat shock protein
MKILIYLKRRNEMKALETVKSKVHINRESVKNAASVAINRIVVPIVVLAGASVIVNQIEKRFSGEKDVVLDAEAVSVEEGAE